MNLVELIPKPLRLDAKCEVCSAAVALVKQAIDNPSTQAEIKGKFLQICSVFPEEYVDEVSFMLIYAVMLCLAMK